MTLISQLGSLLDQLFLFRRASIQRIPCIFLYGFALELEPHKQHP